MKYIHFLDTKEKLSKKLIGGKGYYLYDMQSFIKDESLDGVSIPPASFLTTELWDQYRKDPKKTISLLKKEIIPEMIAYFKKQNDGDMPLISIRSAGAVSMPGMMDTVLNVGMNQKYITQKCMGTDKENDKDTQKFIADSYAQFLAMYGETVLGMDKGVFPHEKPEEIAQVIKKYENIYTKNNQKMPSQKIEEQILNCVLAVFDSWDNERARLYRQINNIDENAGTAVVLQQMVFGNKNKLSATGVMFSRNPSSGKNELTGEFLVQAQGEAVVAGTHTPLNMNQMSRKFPEAYDILKDFAKALEKKYKQMQDIEFTIEDGKVYILQARTAKCSPQAKLQMLMDMRSSRQISSKDVLNNLSKAEYMELNTKQIDSSFDKKPDGTGLVGSMGAINARVVFGASVKYTEPTVYVAEQTTPDDLEAIQLSSSILTAKGGVTSHAAVVARAMGKVCVVGCNDLKIKKDKNGDITAKIGGKEIKSGDYITLDANTGRVWVGKDVPIIDATDSEIFWDLEDLVIDSHKGWTRLASDVDDLESGKQRFYMTYRLDDGDEEFVEKEIADATEYLTGVMDLTGKFDYMQRESDDSFPFSKPMAEKVFLKKKQALLNISKDNFNASYDFKIYLGPYEKKHAGALKLAGFKILPSKEVSFKQDTDEAKYVVSRDINLDVENDKVVISSKNALLGVLK